MQSFPILKQLYEPLSPLGLWLKGAVLLIVGIILNIHPLQPSWAILMTFFAAFLLVPLGFREMQKRHKEYIISDKMLIYHTPSVFLAAIGCCSPHSILAGVLIIPYIVWCFVMVIKVFPVKFTVSYIVLLFSWTILLVANIWLMIERMGLQPFGFSSWILLLTTTHFHYAGFALNMSLALFIYKNPNHIFAKRLSIAAILGIIFTALGIILSQLGFSHFIETLSGVFMSFVAACVGFLFIKNTNNHSKTTQLLWRIGGSCLILAMILAFLYASRNIIVLPFLDIPFMQAIHGTTNALGFGTLILIGFALEEN